MAHRLVACVILLGASLAALGPVLAQTPAAAPADPGTAAPGTPAAPAASAAQKADSDTATQSPASSNTPPTTRTTPDSPTAAPGAPAASAAPTGPSADTLKKARLAGYRPETKHGVTMYCQETANIGTRFPTKKCIDESQLKSVMDVHNDQADSLRQPGACTGAVCTGH